MHRRRDRIGWPAAPRALAVTAIGLWIALSHVFPAPAAAEGLVTAVLEANRRTQWVTLSPGFAMRRLSIAGTGMTVHAWMVDPEHNEIAVVEQTRPEGSTTDEFRAEHKALLAINGGFFEKDGNGVLTPTGLLIVNGERRHPYHKKAGSGALLVAGDKVTLDWSRSASAGQTWTHALQVGPMVVDPGGKNGIRSNDNKRVDRSAVCLAHGRLIFIVIDGGMSLFELGGVLSTGDLKGGFGCERALNLDGGPSTQASFENGGQRAEIAGDWPVQNGIVVTRRK